jgi:hypothetical protein
MLRIGRCSLFWIQPAHDLVNPSVYQSISCLFGCIYHTTTCSLMLATCSHKGDLKIHLDAPRNACDVRTAAGRVCRVLTHRSPNQVIMLNDHYVFIMFHISYDIIVQIISQFMPSIIGNVRIFSRAVCWQYRLNQSYPRSNPNLTHQLNPGDLFPLSCAEHHLGVNPEPPRIPTTST